MAGLWLEGWGRVAGEFEGLYWAYFAFGGGSCKFGYGTIFNLPVWFNVLFRAFRWQKEESKLNVCPGSPTN